jgi:hypothetical protein
MGDAPINGVTGAANGMPLTSGGASKWLVGIHLGKKKSQSNV